MTATTLVVNAEGSETRVGVIEDGVLVEYFVERARERGISGNLYKGRVSRVLPGMQAAFVDLGPTVERRAYLYVADILGGGDEKKLLDGYDSSFATPARSKAARARKIQDLVSPNQEILVQTIKEPLDEKGSRVTGYISLPGRHVVLMPAVDKVGVSRRIASGDERRRLRAVVEASRPKGSGFIVRTAAEGADEQEIRDDVEYLQKLWDRSAPAKKRLRARTCCIATWISYCGPCATCFETMSRKW